jgi:pimeloyl-ACP methyl ester carboxylesterase
MSIENLPEKNLFAMQDAKKLKDSKLIFVGKIDYASEVADISQERNQQIDEALKETKIISWEDEQGRIEVDYFDIPPGKKFEEGEKQEITVILTGFPADATWYSEVGREIARYSPEQRVICISTIGAGKSTIEGKFTLERYNDILEEFFNRLPNEIGVKKSDIALNIIGHSRAGALAILYAAEKGEGLVKNIVTTNGISEEAGLWNLLKDYWKYMNINREGTLMKTVAKSDLKKVLYCLKDFFLTGDFIDQVKSLQARKEVYQKSAQISQKIKGMNLLFIFGEKEIIEPEQAYTLYQIFRENGINTNYTQLMGTKKPGKKAKAATHNFPFEFAEAFAMIYRRWMETKRKEVEEKNIK